jgi:hypothetical protein
VVCRQTSCCISAASQADGAAVVALRNYFLAAIRDKHRARFWCCITVASDARRIPGPTNLKGSMSELGTRFILALWRHLLLLFSDVAENLDKIVENHKK